MLDINMKFFNRCGQPGRDGVDGAPGIPGKFNDIANNDFSNILFLRKEAKVTEDQKENKA